MSVTKLRRSEGATTAPREWPGATIVDVFRDDVRRLGSRPAMRHVAGGRWQVITWAEYGRTVECLAAGLAGLGVSPGDRVGILSGNQHRWHEADMAVLSLGAVTVPVYPTSASSQVAYVLGHSKSSVCFVENRDQLAKVLLRRAELPRLRHVVVFEPAGEGLDDAFVLDFDELVSIGADVLARDPDAVAERASATRPDSLATVVYTSGTTGPPKGAMITHANLMATLRSLTAVIDIGPDDRFLSFLPLSHVAERVVSHFGQVASGGETTFARSLATVAEDLRACRPTIFFAVPRVWQKFQEGILERLSGAPRPVRLLFERYLALGLGRVAADQEGAPWSVVDRLRYELLDRTLGARLRSELGLDRARICVSGAAPIHPDIIRWFHAIGLPVAEVYGQTEDCGPTSLNRPGRIRIGTVGEPLPGVEVRIADDGEILVRGGNVCAGYLDDERATRELIDAEGWMHSGDLGSLTPDGYLVITGRKKDLIITASGKNISPQELETALEAEPLVSHAVVIGEGRPYLTALFTLDAEELARWATARGKIVAPEALADDPDVHEAIAAAVERVNASHARVEQIKHWRILPRDFTVTAGELTPTLKVKRAVVAERYRDAIEELYARA
jgi:long-chain acyl-CoA synthetase